MILALAEQFKQLSDEPEKFRWLNGIRFPSVLETTGRDFSSESVVEKCRRLCPIIEVSY